MREFLSRAIPIGTGKTRKAGEAAFQVLKG